MVSGLVCHVYPGFKGTHYVLCTMNRVFRVNMTLYLQRKEYTFPGNQGTHDKLNQIQFTFHLTNDHMPKL